MTIQILYLNEHKIVGRQFLKNKHYFSLNTVQNTYFLVYRSTLQSVRLDDHRIDLYENEKKYILDFFTTDYKYKTIHRLKKKTVLRTYRNNFYIDKI